MSEAADSEPEQAKKMKKEAEPSDGDGVDGARQSTATAAVATTAPATLSLVMAGMAVICHGRGWTGKRVEREV